MQWPEMTLKGHSGDTLCTSLPVLHQAMHHGRGQQATARNGLTMNSVHGGYQQEQDTLHNIMHHVETVDQTAKAWC